MQLLTRRGQTVLLWIVGLLACMALCCLVLELMGVPVLEPFGVDELFTRHEPTVPSKIVIEEGGAHGDSDSTAAPAPTVSVSAHSG
jgi:hypothetical protein